MANRAPSGCIYCSESLPGPRKKKALPQLPLPLFCQLLPLSKIYQVKAKHTTKAFLPFIKGRCGEAERDFVVYFIPGQSSDFLNPAFPASISLQNHLSPPTGLTTIRS